VTLLKDSVIPAKGVVSTLRNSKRNDIVEVWDFPYEYTHENPFPLFDNMLSQKVDRCFEDLFLSAKSFLA
jgi:hypothetical protein